MLKRLRLSKPFHNPEIKSSRLRVISRIILLLAIIGGGFATFPKTTTVADINGLTWSNFKIGDHHFNSVSCTSASFCMAVDNSKNYAIWNGTVWASKPTGSSKNLKSISCVTPSFCVAVGTDGSSAIWDGSNFSNSIVSTSTQNATAPGAPTIGNATAGHKSATVTWTAPSSDGGSAITGYVVTPYNGSTAQTSQTFNSAATSEVVTGLTDGSSYTFTVTATNSAGTGLASASSNSVTPVSTDASSSSTVTVSMPGAPTIGNATAGHKSATVTWTAPSSDGGSAITGYVVTPYNGSTAQTSQTFNSAATSEVVTGLTDGSSYTFTVTATNSAGTGLASASSNSVTPVSNPQLAQTSDQVTSSSTTEPPASAATISRPGKPIISNAAAGDGSVTVTWTAPSSDGGSAITGYVVTPYNGSDAQATQTFGATATSGVITGLSNGTKYKFRVAAVNLAGTGQQSDASDSVKPKAASASASASSNDSTNPAKTFEAVSCSTTTFCIAVDKNNASFTFNGKAWTSSGQLGNKDGDGNISSLSCTNSNYCMAITKSGSYFTFSSGTWSDGSSIDSGGLASVSCASPTFCAATDSNRYFLTWDGSKWSKPELMNSQTVDIGSPTSISCPTTTFCVVVDNQGNASSWNGTTWNSTSMPGDNSPTLTSVSCSSASFCATVDTNGDAFNGVTSSTITLISPSSGPADTKVTLTGSGFTGATGVSFGKVPATSFKLVSDTSIIAVAPAGSGIVQITVTTGGGTSIPTLSANYSYEPSVTSIDPSSGPVGTPVIISGTGFTNTSVVTFGNQQA